jgi:serine phosphatase RsbU (regulator of sigma subunit)
VLYTDGLIERRGQPIDAALAGLAEAVRRHVALDVERLADAVLDDLRPSSATPDDTVLVIARATG